MIPVIETYNHNGNVIFASFLCLSKCIFHPLYNVINAKGKIIIWSLQYHCQVLIQAKFVPIKQNMFRTLMILSCCNEFMIDA